MWRWVGCLVVGLAAGCVVGPSEEQLRCYEGCARYKDDCVLRATTAPEVQSCDQQGARCSETCR